MIAGSAPCGLVLAKSLVVMATDLGIVASLSEDDLTVWVNSLKTLDGAEDVEIRLFSRNNQELARGRTNRKGVLILEDLKQTLEEEEFKPYLVTATRGEESLLDRWAYG